MAVDTYWNLAPVAQKVDGAIRWINLHPVDNAIGSQILIHWIVIYPVDSAIRYFFETIFLPSQEIFSEKCLLHYRKIKCLHKDDKLRLKVLN